MLWVQGPRDLLVGVRRIESGLKWIGYGLVLSTCCSKSPDYPTRRHNDTSAIQGVALAERTNSTCGAYLILIALCCEEWHVPS